MPNPSPLSERNDAQLLLVFIAQKLLTSSFDHVAARGLGQFSSGENAVWCVKIPEGHILFNNLLQSLELLSFVVKVYCLAFGSGALGLTGHTARSHTRSSPSSESSCPPLLRSVQLLCNLAV